jgi:hypothetical protein
VTNSVFPQEEKLILFSKHYLNDQDKEDEMGRACSTNGGEDECIYDIGVKSRRNETIGKTKT